jgi:predicted dehydrogenase
MPISPRIRVGVIGAGAWAVASHLPVLAARPEVEFVAVSRIGEVQLAKVQQQFGFEFASEDYRDVLEHGIDACIISSPAGLHHEHARAALESGAHVLVEKPFTITASDAWDLVDTAERLDRHLVVAFGNNYLPMVVEFEALLAARGGIGNLEQCMLSMHSVMREALTVGESYPEASGGDIPKPDPATWIDPSLSGGGYGHAQLTHVLGLAIQLLGIAPSEVFALNGTPSGAPVELHNAITLRFPNGAVGTMTGGSSWMGADQSRDMIALRAIGSEGQWKLDLETDQAWVFRAGDTSERRLQLPPGAGIYDCIGPPNTLIDLAMGRDVVNRSPGALAASTVEVLDAIYRSAASGTPVQVVARK